MKKYINNIRYIVGSKKFTFSERGLIKITHFSDSVYDLYNKHHLKLLSDYLEISIDWLVRKDLTKKTRAQMKDNYNKIQEKLKSNAK